MEGERHRQIGWDCSQLVMAFYLALDEQRYPDLVGLFASDGVWNRLGVDLVGPQAIQAALGTRADWLTAHVVSNVQVKVIDADHAETVQYITLYRQEQWPAENGPGPIVPPMGILKHWDKHTRVNNVWKISSKRSRAIMVNRSRVTHYDKPDHD